jgi:hypothetical protein
LKFKLTVTVTRTNSDSDSDSESRSPAEVTRTRSGPCQWSCGTILPHKIRLQPECQWQTLIQPAKLGFKFKFQVDFTGSHGDRIPSTLAVGQWPGPANAISNVSVSIRKHCIATVKGSTGTVTVTSPAESLRPRLEFPGRAVRCPSHPSVGRHGLTVVVLYSLHASGVPTKTSFLSTCRGLQRIVLQPHQLPRYRWTFECLQLDVDGQLHR